MTKDDVVIVSAVRTPFGRFDGLLKSTDSIDLGVMALKEVVDRIGMDPEVVDEVYYGTCIPAEYAIYTNVPARQITLLAGFPESSISLTIDRACCSSMTALRLGYRAIKAGEVDVVIASGAENMGNVPFIASAAKTRWGNRLGPIELEDVLFELGYGRKGFAPVATDAGEVAVEYGVTREMQDGWAAQSHARWHQGLCRREIRTRRGNHAGHCSSEKRGTGRHGAGRIPPRQHRHRQDGKAENRLRESHRDPGQCAGSELGGIGHRDHAEEKGGRHGPRAAGYDRGLPLRRRFPQIHGLRTGPGDRGAAEGHRENRSKTWT